MRSASGNMINFFLKAFAAGIAAVLLIAGGYLYWFSVTHLAPEARIYVVEPGTALKAFSRQLYEQNVLPDPHTLVVLAYLKGQQRQLKTGEYRFRTGITAMELLDQVVAGRVVEYPFTVIEGWNFKQMMQALAAAPRVTRTLHNLKPEQVMASLGYPGMHPEGRFYPDTYYYPAGMSDLLILQRAFDKMDRHLHEAWANRAADLPLESPDEALILASIVEKETGLAGERGLIAGVFTNRLRMGMRLQTDPTVIYGLGDTYTGRIRTRDLRGPTPYNTYVIKGLPPTPIAMPSGAALKAVVNPETTRALYFVSRGDGSHEFSETLEQHNRAVEKYQLQGRKRPNAGSAKGAPPAGTRTTRAAR